MVRKITKDLRHDDVVGISNPGKLWEYILTRGDRKKTIMGEFTTQEENHNGGVYYTSRKP